MNIVTGLPDLSLACTRNESATTLMLVKPDCCKLFVNCWRRLDPPGCGLVVVAADGAMPELGLADCAKANEETVVRIAAATSVVFFIANSPFWIAHPSNRVDDSPFPKFAAWTKVNSGYAAITQGRARSAYAGTTLASAVRRQPGQVAFGRLIF